MGEFSEYFFNLTKGGAVPLSRFVREALYNPQFGYYMRKQKRVGKRGDFYTSSTLNAQLFSSLLQEAFGNIAEKYFGGEKFGFCEIGAEPELNLFENSRVIRVGEKTGLRGNLFVFSNELLDAQPFDRFVFKGGEIFKTHCAFGGGGGIKISLEKSPDCEAEVLKKYFAGAPEGFVLDFSFDALALLEKICAQNWRGVLIFADYFRLAGEILSLENGTARSYFKHRASSDIFFNAPFSDITFSPPIEPFLDILSSFGFEGASCVSQGAFFMQNSPRTLKSVVENAGVFSAQKRALAELVSPAHMGEVFRVLSAARL
ncbi:MAG: SAM-dependent methyltransferase [Opitutales bacterium]|nr:SAM-dependent methyltransferase [Opitutales bacterium]